MKEGQFIPGIYNWCDRWCERCQYTPRCRVYEKEESRKQANPDQDVWGTISDSFQEALQLLHKAADEMGISLELNQEESDRIMAEEKALDQEVEKLPLHFLADEYLDQGKDWIESKATKDYLLHLQSQVEIGTLQEKDVEQMIKILDECLEVIQWYLFFVAVKIGRALREKIEGFWDDYPVEERGDLGTAKIAMIAIERSLVAWAKIYQLIPDDDQILHLLAKLEKMRRLLKEEFPDYSKFKRPGFDDN
ncbi:hypothetical protein [Algoriphagus hitonicola]|uniref:Uncharacterized protein n=1 Tax=Algoriphagus hitonicola TaxID=435880 RepID=A0A1I2NJY2_9BACT|nr:hypothetical protein [Algoriphagus hitonicola]SFG01611.1 hypothetical protein SAMN04487988_10140 [Algoriphagus hitonicola]